MQFLYIEQKIQKTLEKTKSPQEQIPADSDTHVHLFNLSDMKLSMADFFDFQAASNGRTT